MLHTVPVRKLNADKCAANDDGNLRLSGGRAIQLDVLMCQSVAVMEGRPMNSLFLGLLTLFFAQGLVGRDNRAARGMAILIVAALAVAFTATLR
jgi:hypothetical protein